MGQIERLLAALSVLLIFVYVVLRAIYVPTFHDEAATFFHYIVSENFLPFQAHWDANNHILNSALGFLCYKIFGPHQWWIRLPNALSFLVFGYFTVRISEDIRNRLIRWVLLISVLTAAFPLEFFSQARGYAMSIAFMMGAVYNGTQYLKNHKLKNQILLWSWMWLAVAASLTLANTYLILLGLVLLAVVKNHESRLKHLLVWLIFGVSFFLASAYYGLELKNRGLLYTGFDDGFIEITVRSLVKFQLGADSYVLALFCAGLGGLAATILIVQFLMFSLKWTTIRLMAVVLLLNATGSIMLNLLFGMNFPENRVGMYYIPLLLFTVAGLLDLAAQRTPRTKWLTLPLLIFPIHLTQHFNLDTTLLWSRWHASKSIYDKAVHLQQSGGQVLTVSAHYLNELGWAYYNFLNNAEMQLLQRDPVPDTLADLIVARPEDFDFEDVPYDALWYDEPNDIYLLRRNLALRWSESVSPKPLRIEFSGTDEFYEILNDSISKLSGSIGLLELKGVFNCSSGLFDGQLVITSSSPNGGTYNMVPLHWIQPEWNNDLLHIKRTFHFSEDATNVKVYFWNIHRDSISFKLDELTFRSPE